MVTIVSDGHYRAHNEFDTNADTCCLGKNFVILEYTRRAIKPIENVPIVSATAWDDPVTGDTYILVINEALYYERTDDQGNTTSNSRSITI